MTIDVHVRLNDPTKSDESVAGSPATLIASADGVALAAGIMSNTASVEVDETPLGKARRLQDERPTMALIHTEWADKLGYPARELARAKAREVLGKPVQGRGRANRGHLIPVGSIIHYLEMVDGVKRGQRAAPDWYDEVVKGRGRKAA